MDTPHQFNLGRWVGSTDHRLAALERGQRRMRRDFDRAVILARRVGLLIVLWVAAIAVNMDPDRLADLLLELLKIVLRRG